MQKNVETKILQPELRMLSHIWWNELKKPSFLGVSIDICMGNAGLYPFKCWYQLYFTILKAKNKDITLTKRIEFGWEPILCYLLNSSNFWDF